MSLTIPGNRAAAQADDGVTMASASAAVAPRDRLPLLDVLRGFALFGILVMNMPAFSWTGSPDKLSEQVWPAWWDHVELFTARWFFSGKFNSLFSLLFGVGFTLQLARLDAPVRTYLRRLGALLLFGLVHAILVWHGDILLNYVEIGIVLLALRRASDRTILILAFVALLVGPASTAIHQRIITPAEIQENYDRAVRITAEANTAFSAGGTYLQGILLRLEDLRDAYTRPWGIPWHFQLTGTALLGCYAARRRVLLDPERHLVFFRRLLLGAVLAGVVGVAVWSFARARWVPRTFTPLSVASSFAYNIQRPAIMLAYVSAFVLVTKGRVPVALQNIALAGRMSLTNYLMQSLVCTAIFYPFGLGLYNKVGPALGFGLAVVVYAAQVALSAWWLRRFEFGPMEWLWRRMTYGAQRRGREAVPLGVVTGA